MQRESTDGLRAAVAANGSPADAVLVAAVPAVLVAVFLLPETTREAFVLDYRAPTAVDLYASHFVHFGRTHLAANLAAYAAAALPAYCCCAAAGRRTDFLAAFGAVLAVFPYALSGLNAVFVRPSVGYGFSGLAMAFLGFLPVALALFARERLLPGVSLDHAPLLFFAGAGTVAVLAVPASRFALVGVAVAAVGVAAYGRSLWRAVDASRLRAALGRAGDAELAAAGVVLVLAAPFVAFPPDAAGDGYVLNVYSHLLGFCLGFIAPYTALRLAAVLE
ncbi:hypothetical protein [Halobacterium rubrum]|uniref:hypothetical protein n=1 Tax=Halobacterium TaxID=2239 RepID=UPI001F2DFFF9|nr:MULTISPECIES: hypothetical protein [Halobacterium]MDH5018729.1 hypothetical protein [Halobacterium rubrum]